MAGTAVYLAVRIFAGQAEHDGSSSEAPAASKSGSTSGPSRLQEGAKQVDDPATGRAVAREALARVDAELAMARGAEEVRRLERKRALIIEALQRLGAPAAE